MPANDNIAADERYGCTNWFAAIIVCLGLIAVGYIAFTADYGPAVITVEGAGR